MWWEVLGISYDADLKTVKKAYAKLIKKAKPDEDPEAFIRLQKAYIAAKEHHQEKPSPFVPAKTKGDKVDKIEIVNLDFETELIDNQYSNESVSVSFDSENVINTSERETISLKESFLSNTLNERTSVQERFLTLYQDIEKRKHIKYWNNFFSDLNLMEEFTIGETLVSLMSTHRVFSKSVWNHIYSYICEDGQTTSDFLNKLNEIYPDYSFALQSDGRMGQIFKYYEVRHQLYEYTLGLRNSIDQEDFLQVMTFSMQDREYLHLFSDYSRENKIDSFFEMYEKFYSHEHYDLITSRVHHAEFYRENGNIGQALSLYRTIDSGVHRGIYSKIGIARCEGHYMQAGFSNWIKQNYKNHVLLKYIYYKEIKKDKPIIKKDAIKRKEFGQKNKMNQKDRFYVVFHSIILMFMFYLLYVFLGLPVKFFADLFGITSLTFFEDLCLRVIVMIFIAWFYDKFKR